MSKLIGNQEFNGDVFVKGLGGYDGSTTSGVSSLQTVVDSKGTYSKPSGGIPASDLASGVIPDVSALSASVVDNKSSVTSLSASVVDNKSNITSLSASVVTNKNNITSLSASVIDNNNRLDELSAATDTLQEKLVSGTNIKTINGQSLLGSGDITITGGISGTGVTAIVALTESEYAALSSKSSTTLYIVTPDPVLEGNCIKISNASGDGTILEVGTGLAWQVGNKPYLVGPDGTRIGDNTAYWREENNSGYITLWYYCNSSNNSPFFVFDSVGSVSGVLDVLVAGAEYYYNV